VSKAAGAGAAARVVIGEVVLVVMAGAVAAVAAVVEVATVVED